MKMGINKFFGFVFLCVLDKEVVFLCSLDKVELKYELIYFLFLILFFSFVC